MFAKNLESVVMFRAGHRVDRVGHYGAVVRSAS